MIAIGSVCPSLICKLGAAINSPVPSCNRRVKWWDLWVKQISSRSNSSWNPCWNSEGCYCASVVSYSWDERWLNKHSRREPHEWKAQSNRSTKSARKPTSWMYELKQLLTTVLQEELKNIFTDYFFICLRSDSTMKFFSRKSNYIIDLSFTFNMLRQFF